MSLGKGIGIAAGTLGVLLGTVALGSYVLVDRILVSAVARPPSPPGWLDSVRARGHLPDLTGLVIERTVDGDASVMAYDSTQWLQASPEVAGLFQRVVMNDSVAPTAGDTALWRTVASDTALDRFVGLARMRGWAALSRALPGDSTGLFSIHFPRSRAVVERLVLRALWRAAHRDVPGARTDLAAVMSIGERMFRREPVIGLRQGVRNLGYAVRAYTKLAAVTRDSVLTRRIQPVSEWLRLTPDIIVRGLQEVVWVI